MSRLPEINPDGALRHADPERDGAVCAALYAPHVRSGAVSFEEEPPDGTELARRIARTSTTHPWLVLERDERVVGFAYARPHGARAAYRWAADVSVYVAASHQRRGAGRTLYEALFDLLLRQRLRTACAGITQPNAASVALHEALGFVAVGVFPRIGFKDGAWRDVGWWQLELGAADEDPPAEPLGPQRLPAPS